MPRLFGPVSKDLASKLSDEVLDHPHMLKVLAGYFAGEYDDAGFAYRVQLLAEAVELGWASSPKEPPDGSRCA